MVWAWGLLLVLLGLHRCLLRGTPSERGTLVNRSSWRYRRVHSGLCSPRELCIEHLCPHHLLLDLLR